MARLVIVHAPQHRALSGKYLYKAGPPAPGGSCNAAKSPCPPPEKPKETAHAGRSS
ncbi:conserved hypothetical protein [Cupriavidus taiwanensis]|uniref:Uncharacterized protein n=1 Tax=Cupriavidus taiwanensis TaxID=164546 RepID=A0A375JCV6_9BURK|nr:conserved hypothetical protein [Cupriavidus taiwanensis]